MDVTDRKSAQAWIRAWNGKPGKTYLKMSLEGMYRCKCICLEYKDLKRAKGFEEALDELSKCFIEKYGTEKD